MIQYNTNRSSNIRKIALLLNELQGGGAERIMITLANAWVAQAIEVDFLVGKYQGPYQKLLSKDLNIITFEKQIRDFLPDVVSYLNQHQPDILLSTVQAVNVVAALAGKISRTKTKIVLREANSPKQKVIAEKGWKAIFLHGTLSRYSYRLADGYVSVSEGLKKEMVDFYGLDEKRIKTIYNPVVNRQLFELSQKPINQVIRKGEEKIIMAMGRVVPQKDFMTLINAFAIVRKKRDCRLVILGETQSDPLYFHSLLSLAQELEVEEDVIFIGFQDNPFAYLAKADVFVLSSRYEGLPGGLIQAMALGCQLVSTDCPHGPSEILENGKYGSLVPVGNSAAMAKAIEDRLQNSHARKNKHSKLEDFSASKAISEYLDFFEQLLI